MQNSTRTNQWRNMPCVFAAIYIYIYTYIIIYASTPPSHLALQQPTGTNQNRWCTLAKNKRDHWHVALHICVDIACFACIPFDSIMSYNINNSEKSGTVKMSRNAAEPWTLARLKKLCSLVLSCRLYKIWRKLATIARRSQSHPFLRPTGEELLSSSSPSPSFPCCFSLIRKLFTSS